MYARVRDRSIEFRRSLFSQSEFRSNRFETSWRPKPIFFKSNKKLSTRFKTNLRLSECTCNSQVSNDRLNSRSTCRKSSNVALNSLAIIRYVLQKAIKISREDQAIVLTVFKASLETRVSSRVESLVSRVERNEILVSREGGNLLLSGTVNLLYCLNQRSYIHDGS